MDETTTAAQVVAEVLPARMEPEEDRVGSSSMLLLRLLDLESDWALQPPGLEGDDDVRLADRVSRACRLGDGETRSLLGRGPAADSKTLDRELDAEADAEADADAELEDTVARSVTEADCFR